MARKPRTTQAQPRRRKGQGTEEDRQAILERGYRDSRSAFTSWETAQGRTDEQLYKAIGRLAAFAAAVGNDHEALTRFAAEKGVRATKASTPYTVVTKLVVTADRRKASKYATVLQLAARKGIDSTADGIAAFIKEEGGVEACLRSFRELPRASGAPRRQGRPSAFGQAVGRIAGLDRAPAPDGLLSNPVPGEYFLVVGVRDADGTMHLLREPVTDDGLVRKAVVMVAPKA